jgi:nucleoside 2-deoxyribosyltransferase
MLYRIADSPRILAEAPMRIYLAGPLGFSEAGRNFRDCVMLPELSRLGFQLIDPFNLTDQRKIEGVLGLPTAEARREAWKKLNMEIGQNNQIAIDGCDAVLAILDGADVDSGTASEIGYAFARHKPILGYRSDFRLSSDNEGSVVNLQVEYFIRAGGGQIVSSLSKLADALLRLPKSKP